MRGQAVLRQEEGVRLFRKRKRLCVWARAEEEGLRTWGFRRVRVRCLSSAWRTSIRDRYATGRARGRLQGGSAAIPLLTNPQAILEPAVVSRFTDCGAAIAASALGIPFLLWVPPQRWELRAWGRGSPSAAHGGAEVCDCGWGSLVATRTGWSSDTDTSLLPCSS